MGGVRRVAAWGVVLVMTGAWGLGGCSERASQAPTSQPTPNTPPSNPSDALSAPAGGLGAAKTALVVVALDPSGGVKVQGVKVKPTPWGAQTTPFDAKRHLPGAEVEVEEPHDPTQGQAPDPTQGQAPDPTQGQAPAQGVGAGTQAGPSDPTQAGPGDPTQGAPHEDHEGHDHFHEPAAEDPKAPWVLALVVEHPSLPAPWVVEQRLDPPGSSSGDVVGPFEAGGATWKAPWPGEGAKIKVIRVAPRGPALLGTWGAR